MKFFLALLTASLLIGCATQPKDLPTAYVSPLQYQNYSCDQIAMEMNRVSRKVNEVRSDLKGEADNDLAPYGNRVNCFLASTFLSGRGDGANAAEFSRLKGEFEALESISIQKSCGIQVQQTDS